MVYTTTQKIVSVMTDFKNKLHTKGIGKKLQSLDEDKFILLLSAASSAKKWPPLLEQMPFDRLYQCRTFEERDRTAEWLEENFKIADWVSLESACRDNFNIHEEYKHFWAEWHNMSFDTQKADPATMFKLKRCEAYAKNFSAIIGEGGFWAWDCDERLALCRLALAANIISEEEYRYTVTPIAKKSSQLYNNWVEYTLSYLAGYLYHTYQQHNCSEEITPQFKMAYSLVQYLFDTQWFGKEWYEFSTEYALDKSEMKKLIDWDGPDMCIATNRITVDHFPVGFMYREVPDSNFPDSGWRFYQGMEDDEYSFDMSNSGMHTLNDICNYDPSIMPYLDSPIGTRLMRTPNGTFIPEYEEDE